ncbi:hypothetical protein ACSS6W_006819 [Trichoderma asperelloides]|uniref:Uncharacterized protein n=1 Tax=Trichoderma asperellum TaxID=101201 RepID=A0A6V8R8W9_TRIAP|nr:hypothetical protein LI328DRAFT_52609 [Trichoderma asperelloides]GFP60545.1 hypothetical protein TASIC1_0020002900 [Trichoderma asperellum]
MSGFIKPLEYQLPSDGSSKWSQRAKAFLVVCSHRMWRGGPRSILQITAVAFVLLMLFFFVPLQFDDHYQQILNWSAPDSAASSDLRIVVFGSQDLLGSAPDAEHTQTSWPEHLCKQLNCRSVLSFVPPIDSQPGLTSNSLYGTEIRALEMVSEQVNLTEKPALDNLYIPKQYPVPIKTPDLEAQVQRFLTMAPPKLPPRETLWVFSFGTWETWNLASLPRASGERLIDESVANIFAQIELLYRKSLNPKSPAFSDFWSNVTKAEVQALTHPEPDKKPDERRMESFRVVIPQLFDITLVPGWQNRPIPSQPQSRGVQLRNAAYLTKRWNSQVSKQIEQWRRKADSKPEGIEDEGIETAVAVPTMTSLLRYLPEALQPKEADATEGIADEDVIYAPYPRRLGLQSTLVANVLDAMTEEEMQRSGLKDSKGRGSMPADGAMRFFDVWTPCIADNRAITGVDTSHPSQECDVPNDHLFYDGFTFGERAKEELAKKTAEQIKDQLFV